MDHASACWLWIPGQAQTWMLQGPVTTFLLSKTMGCCMSALLFAMPTHTHAAASVQTWLCVCADIGLRKPLVQAWVCASSWYRHRFVQAHAKSDMALCVQGAHDPSLSAPIPMHPYVPGSHACRGARTVQPCVPQSAPIPVHPKMCACGFRTQECVHHLKSSTLADGMCAGPCGVHELRAPHPLLTPPTCTCTLRQPLHLHSAAAHAHCGTPT